MKTKLSNAYMDTAYRFAELSTAVKRKVGAIVVKDDRIISIGYNGTVPGWDNTCEYKSYMAISAPQWIDYSEVLATWPYEDSEGRYKLITYSEVMHAERNAIDKLARSNESGLGAVMFVTHAPCLECAKSIYGAGIKEVHVGNSGNRFEGIDFLKKCAIIVHIFDN